MIEIQLRTCVMQLSININYQNKIGMQIKIWNLSKVKPYFCPNMSNKKNIPSYIIIRS